MILEFKQVSKILLVIKKILNNLELNLINLDIMKQCLNLLKVKQQDVLKLLMQFKYKLDGCKNYGNILKNVKKDLTTI